MTINIQSKSNMKVPLTSFFGPEKKFPHGGSAKKMPSNEIPNDMVVHAVTFSNDEKIGCPRAERRAILASINKKQRCLS
jgi:hypothetical protein